ncbi:phototropic-responsive NPH3 family protein NPY4-like [Primulina huaijiensis]|uniref:phototropic-responsive NPH3 family protein NPY4-like n=1 Tax=Primulina huaijiensis TaxID=1492673 RepID=UPI003CC78B34
MKFMKLGSKPDQFQTDGDNIRYVATELATDIVISVGDVKFYLHKFPLLSKSSHLQKLVSNVSDETNDEIDVHDIPGGPAAFEICAKFCYGMVVTLNAYNVVSARCAAEYLEMFEIVEKGNLVYKIDVFLTSSIFRSWKDSIIILQTTKSLLPWSEELKIVNHCLDSVANKASTHPSKVDFSYAFNRKKFLSKNEISPRWNGVKKKHTVPKDWWVEDLCELHIDLYKQVVATINAKGIISAEGIGESVKAYIIRRVPGFNKGVIQGGDTLKYRYLVDTIIWLLPLEKNSVSCSFLLKLLHVSIELNCGETGRCELMQRIACQLEEASVADFLVCSPSGEVILYDINLVHELVEKFIMLEHSSQSHSTSDHEFPEACAGCYSDASKMKVARFVDGYLAEAAKDSSLSLSRFVNLFEIVSSFPRPTHDGIYMAIDIFMKEHPGLSKSEKKKICRLIDCKKLSADACTHAVRNERLPLRVVVQVLFFEQARAAAASGGSSTSDLPGSSRSLLPGGSYGSSRSATTNTDEDWDGDQMTKELKALKLRNIGGNRSESGPSNGTDAEKLAAKKVKKIFSRLWAYKDRQSENSSSDTSESITSTSLEERRSTSSRNRRHPLS